MWAVRPAPEAFVSAVPLRSYLAGRCVVGHGACMTKAETYPDDQDWATKVGERHLKAMSAGGTAHGRHRVPRLEPRCR